MTLYNLLKKIDKKYGEDISTQWMAEAMQESRQTRFDSTPEWISYIQTAIERKYKLAEENKRTQLRLLDLQ